MSGASTGQVTSADGTSIVFDRSGEGPVIILVHGAFTGRGHPFLSDVAAALAPWFTVINYDRRGRGGSGDTQPYAAERELEDLTALLDIAGGSAMVFGGSSGAGLALQAAPQNRAISKLAVWEPPQNNHYAWPGPSRPTSSSSSGPATASIAALTDSELPHVAKNV